MESNDPGKNEAGDAIEDLLKEISGDSEKVLGEFVRLQDHRIERLKAEQQYLKDTLGEGHPDVVARGVSAKEAEQFKAALQTRAKK